MKWGPVPSQAYDMIKAAAGIQQYSQIDVTEALTAKGSMLATKRAAREELLSDSERACLIGAVERIGSKSFKERTDETHDAVWEAASEKGGDQRRRYCGRPSRF
jgi:hypothetical protein